MTETITEIRREVQSLTTREGVQLTETEAFEQVKAAVEQATAIHYDDCHKIYISLDQAAADQQREYGYDVVAPHLATVLRWYRTACSLVFISAIRTEGDEIEFIDLIPQFTYWADEEDEETPA